MKQYSLYMCESVDYCRLALTPSIPSVKVEKIAKKLQFRN